MSERVSKHRLKPHCGSCTRAKKGVCVGNEMMQIEQYAIEVVNTCNYMFSVVGWSEELLLKEKGNIQIKKKKKVA